MDYFCFNCQTDGTIRGEIDRVVSIGSNGESGISLLVTVLSEFLLSGGRIGWTLPHISILIKLLREIGSN